MKKQEEKKLHNHVEHIGNFDHEECDCAHHNEIIDCTKVTGILCNVGHDFLDIRRFDGTVVTVLRDQIKKIDFTDKDCGPCGDHHDSECECHDHRHHDCICDCHDCHDHFDDCDCCFGIELRLAGLRNSLNIKLESLIGCEITIRCPE